MHGRSTLFAALVVIVACDLPAPADGVAADRGALSQLPPALAREFAVRELLTADALRDTARVRCELLGQVDSVDVRRRLRARLADDARTVLFVRAARRDGALRRVELVRRAPRGGSQRGFIWNAGDDAVQSVLWPPGAVRPEVTTLPRGGPTPGALRALGRALLALPCPAVGR